MPTAHLKDGSRLEYLPEPIGEGAMKRVYMAADHQSVVCFYKDQQKEANDPNRRERLDRILGPYNPTVAKTQGGAANSDKDAAHFRELFCWVTGIVLKPEFGIVTPVYFPNYFFASGNWKGKEKKGKWFSSPKLRGYLPPEERGNLLNYVLLCNRMARAVRKLHFMGLAHSDLSHSNVLLDPLTGRCLVIDIDSLVVPGVFPPDVIGTTGYIAPEVLATQHLDVKHPQRKLPSSATDLHALAVLIYESLLLRHPLQGLRLLSQDSAEDDRLMMGEKALFIEDRNDSSNHIQVPITCDQFGPHLSALFHEAFGPGLHNPGRRPPASAWESALALTLDLMVPCGNASCPDRWFVLSDGPSPQCPRCRWAQSTPLPVLEFYMSRRSGQFRPDQRSLAVSQGRQVFNLSLVGWHGRALYAWHAFDNVPMAEGADVEVQADFAFHNGEWFLTNRRLAGMTTGDGIPVPVGQSTPLKPGAEILLTNRDHGRLAVVRMTH